MCACACVRACACACVCVCVCRRARAPTGLHFSMRADAPSLDVTGFAARAETVVFDCTGWDVRETGLPLLTGSCKRLEEASLTLESAFEAGEESSTAIHGNSMRGKLAQAGTT